LVLLAQLFLSSSLLVSRRLWWYQNDLDLLLD